LAIANTADNRVANFEAICRQADAAIVYAFGSRAREVRGWLRGEQTSLAAGPSDVDVAVKFLPGTEIGVDERVSLAIAIEDLLGVNRVDLVDLDQADAFLAANAIRGSRLYAEDAYLADEYDLYVLRRAGDLAPLEHRRIALIVRSGSGHR
jgi:uncharacterized protein